MGDLNRVHGDCVRAGKTPEHVIWESMRKRCTNPTSTGYKNYGGRGIQICDRWRESNGIGYMNFLEDMGRKPSPKHTLDRIDNNGHYCKENCRWVTMKEQGRNRRNSRFITGFGKTQVLAAWAEEYNISYASLYGRLKAGMTLEEAITHPKRKAYQKLPKSE